jgi:hypothetical protein
MDCGTVVNPNTVQAQIQSGIIFGASAALYGEITLNNGRVEQSTFDTYQVLRINEAPAIDVHIVESSEPHGWHGRDRDLSNRSRRLQCGVRRDRQASAQDAGGCESAEAAGVN